MDTSLKNPKDRCEYIEINQKGLDTKKRRTHTLQFKWCFMKNVIITKLKIKGCKIWCHLLGKTTEDLLRACDELGLPSKKIDYAGTPYEHVDLDEKNRCKALELGAEETDSDLIFCK